MTFFENLLYWERFDLRLKFDLKLLIFVSKGKTKKVKIIKQEIESVLPL